MTLQESDLQALTERLGKLEKSNRRMRQMVLVVLVLASAVMLMGQAAPRRTVEANEFILQDQNGRPVGRWGMRPITPDFAIAEFALYEGNRKKVVVDGTGNIEIEGSETRVGLSPTGFGIGNKDGSATLVHIGVSKNPTAGLMSLSEEKGPYSVSIGRPRDSSTNRPAKSVLFMINAYGEGLSLP